MRVSDLALEDFRSYAGAELGISSQPARVGAHGGLDGQRVPA